MTLTIKYILFLIISITSLSLYGHSGRTNSSGCHNDRKNGGYHCHGTSPRPQQRQVSTTENVEETVIFNIKNRKYHKPSCRSAHACTKNCITIDKKKALENGGVPCGSCGG